MCSEIKQTVVFSASAKEIYDLLMDSKKHTLFTEAQAKIKPIVGGKVIAYDGYIEGKNIELIQNKKIVQEWRATDWDEGLKSIATFSLNECAGKTTLTFIQTNVPDSEVKSISEGWKEFYWNKMKKFLKTAK